MRCSVGDDECVPGRLRVGMCERHYRRQLKSGSTASPRLDNLGQYRVLPNGCWRWTGAAWRNGYGKTSVKMHGTRIAHRVFYNEHVGLIPEDHDVDHLCHNADVACVGGWTCPHRLCVNPVHLEPVPHVTNMVRGIQSRSICQNGLHDLSLPDSVRPGTHQCTECWRTRYRAASRRYRDKQVAK